MMELAQANWPLLVAALVIGLLVAWLIFVAMRRTKVDTDTSDVLDEGKGPANRNQALIDSPASAEAPPIAPVPAAGIAGAGTAVAAATQQAADTAKASVDTRDEADDLTRIKGVGPKLKALLISLDVTKFDQIANWTDAEIDAIDAQLGRFEGRIRRDNWMEQAKFLASDDTAGYEGKFGKL